MPRAFQQDYTGVGELLKSGGVDAQLRPRAEAVAARARASAPVASGAYRASIRVERHVTDRVHYTVVADVAYANVVEFATRNLGRALDAAGGG
jgi:hypothetical protein